MLRVQIFYIANLCLRGDELSEQRAQYVPGTKAFSIGKGAVIVSNVMLGYIAAQLLKNSRH